MTTFDLHDFGAVGDGVTLDTLAFQGASHACRDAGGGTLRIPPGIYLTGIFELFSGTTLLVEKGARIVASPKLEDHVVDNASVGLIYARAAQDITITGEGILDGNAKAFFDEKLLNGSHEDFSGNDTWQKRHGLPYGTRELVHGPLGSHGRPGNMIIFGRCRNVKIERVTLTGAAYWTLHCADCEDVTIEHLIVDNDLRHANNDGIHITSSKRVAIRHCRIAAGDDAIALTGFREPAGEAQIAFGMSGKVGVCEEIEISDCVLTSRSAGVRIGYGHNPTRRVKISRVEIRESNRGIGLFARQADVEDVVIEDCRIGTKLFHGNWWGRGEPIQISAVRFFKEPELFHVRRVALRDIEITGENAVTLFAEEPGAIDDVTMTRVHATLKRGELFDSWGGNADLRPAPADLSIFAGGLAPFWAVGVTHLRLEDCRWEVDASGDGLFSAEPIIVERQA